MLKYIGALVVFVSCTLSGLTLCEREKLKLRQCEAFLSLFEYVKIRYIISSRRRSRFTADLKTPCSRKQAFLQSYVRKAAEFTETTG